MLKQISLKDAVGKTIVKTKGCDYDDNTFIVFDDGTFVYLNAGYCYDSLRLEDDTKFGIGSMWGEHVELGIVTQAEIAEHAKQKEAERLRQQDAQERAAYERLKAKFEE